MWLQEDTLADGEQAEGGTVPAASALAELDSLAAGKQSAAGLGDYFWRRRMIPSDWAV